MFLQPQGRYPERPKLNHPTPTPTFHQHPPTVMQGLLLGGCDLAKKEILDLATSLGFGQISTSPMGISPENFRRKQLEPLKQRWRQICATDSIFRPRSCTSVLNRLGTTGVLLSCFGGSLSTMLSCVFKTFWWKKLSHKISILRLVYLEVYEVICEEFGVPLPPLQHLASAPQA